MKNRIGEVFQKRNLTINMIRENPNLPGIESFMF